MAYFSRLTDIVTCNVSSLIAKAQDPAAALEEIIREINEGVAGAERSTRTAQANVVRIECEIGEQRQQVGAWLQQAQVSLRANDESAARQALLRKHEVEDLIAGLEQQLHAAVSTRDHLQTMMNALQARLADAQRRSLAFRAGEAPEVAAPGGKVPPAAEPVLAHSRVDAELEALRRQLGAG